jgi:hypothetical protein
MNKWGIPAWLEREVRQRDKKCVYCGVPMLESRPANGSRTSVATWEHIINDARIVTRGNIARCCASCNSSKGTKQLSLWIESSYCKRHRIDRDTVADVVKQAFAVTPNPIAADGVARRRRTARLASRQRVDLKPSCRYSLLCSPTESPAEDHGRSPN